MTMARAMSLKNVKVSTIKPYKKTDHPAILEPSLFDLTFLDVYIPVIFFYKPEEGQRADAFDDLVERLKESLSKALVLFFPLAGRWVKTYDARIRELECDDEGVTFIEAYIDENLDSVVRLNDFEANELFSGHQFVGLDPKSFHQAVDHETPLPSLFVQVTRFQCGSFALNLTFCHMTTDVKALISFMEAWSEIAVHGQTSIVPVHDRSLTISLGEFMKSVADDTSGEGSIEPENDNTKTVAKNDANGEGPVEAENVSTESVENNDTKTTKRADPGVALRFPSGFTRNKTLHLRRQIILDLKQEAAQQNITVTTLDLITAILWRSLNRFPESMDGKNLSLIGTGMEGRQRFHDPPLPDRYTGNALIACCIPPIPASDLAAGDSPIFAASLVHKTVQGVNKSNWKSFVVSLTEQLSHYPNLPYRIYLLTSWLRYPMYEIEFGHGFGKPVFAGGNYALGFLPYGLAIVQPPPPSLADRAIASIQLTTTSDEVAKTFLADEQFREFFLPFGEKTTRPPRDTGLEKFFHRVGTIKRRHSLYT